jgi:hypothetical protein
MNPGEGGPPPLSEDELKEIGAIDAKGFGKTGFDNANGAAPAETTRKKGGSQYQLKRIELLKEDPTAQPDLSPAHVSPAGGAEPLVVGPAPRLPDTAPSALPALGSPEWQAQLDTDDPDILAAAFKQALESRDPNILAGFKIGYLKASMSNRAEFTERYLKLGNEIFPRVIQEMGLQPTNLVPVRLIGDFFGEELGNELIKRYLDSLPPAERNNWTDADIEAAKKAVELGQDDADIREGRITGPRASTSSSVATPDTTPSAPPALGSPEWIDALKSDNPDQIIPALRQALESGNPAIVAQAIEEYNPGKAAVKDLNLDPILRNMIRDMNLQPDNLDFIRGLAVFRDEREIEHILGDYVTSLPPAERAKWDDAWDDIDDAVVAAIAARRPAASTPPPPGPVRAALNATAAPATPDTSGGTAPTSVETEDQIKERLLAAYLEEGRARVDQAIEEIKKQNAGGKKLDRNSLNAILNNADLPYLQDRQLKSWEELELLVEYSLATPEQLKQLKEALGGEDSQAWMAVEEQLVLMSRLNIYKGDSKDAYPSNFLTNDELRKLGITLTPDTRGDLQIAPPFDFFSLGSQAQHWNEQTLAEILNSPTYLERNKTRINNERNRFHGQINNLVGESRNIDPAWLEAFDSGDKSMLRELLRKGVIDLNPTADPTRIEELLDEAEKRTKSHIIESIRHSDIQPTDLDFIKRLRSIFTQEECEEFAREYFKGLSIAEKGRFTPEDEKNWADIIYGPATERKLTAISKERGRGAKAIAMGVNVVLLVPRALNEARKHPIEAISGIAAGSVSRNLITGGLIFAGVESILAAGVGGVALGGMTGYVRESGRQYTERTGERASTILRKREVKKLFREVLNPRVQDKTRLRNAVVSGMLAGAAGGAIGYALVQTGLLEAATTTVKDTVGGFVRNYASNTPELQGMGGVSNKGEGAAPIVQPDRVETPGSEPASAPIRGIFDDKELSAPLSPAASAPPPPVSEGAGVPAGAPPSAEAPGGPRVVQTITEPQGAGAVPGAAGGEAGGTVGGSAPGGAPPSGEAPAGPRIAPTITEPQGAGAAGAAGAGAAPGGVAGGEAPSGGGGAAPINAEIPGVKVELDSPAWLKDIEANPEVNTFERSLQGEVGRLYADPRIQGDALINEALRGTGKTVADLQRDNPSLLDNMRTAMRGTIEQHGNSSYNGYLAEMQARGQINDQSLNQAIEGGKLNLNEWFGTGGEISAEARRELVLEAKRAFDVQQGIIATREQLFTMPEFSSSRDTKVPLNNGIIAFRPNASLEERVLDIALNYNDLAKEWYNIPENAGKPIPVALGELDYLLERAKPPYNDRNALEKLMALLNMKSNTDEINFVHFSDKIKPGDPRWEKLFSALKDLRKSAA